MAFVGSAYYSSYYIQQNGNLTLTNLNCSQSDSRIVDCSYSLVHGHVPDCYADGTARCYGNTFCMILGMGGTYLRLESLPLLPYLFSVK